MSGLRRESGVIYGRAQQDWAANALALGVGAVLTARWWATCLFRISQGALLVHPLLAGVVKQLNQFATGADLAPGADIGGGLVLLHPNGVVIGAAVSIGEDCHIQQGVTIGSKHGTIKAQFSGDKCPRIGDGARLGAGARLLGGIAIGDDVIVGANAVVLSDIPSRSTAVGVPARITTRSP